MSLVAVKYIHFFVSNILHHRPVSGRAEALSSEVPVFPSARWALLTLSLYLVAAGVGAICVIIAAVVLAQPRAAWLLLGAAIFGAVWRIRLRTQSLLRDDKLSLWQWRRSRISIESINPEEWSIALNAGSFGLHTNQHYFLKRAFDIVVSLAILILGCPIWIILGLLIKIDSPGPVMYRQARVGLDGRIFTVFRFRSMRLDAEIDGRPRWAAKGDPRITRVGAIIRKSRS